jgi:hypothetical protein
MASELFSPIEICGLSVGVCLGGNLLVKCSVINIFFDFVRDSLISEVGSLAIAAC